MNISKNNTLLISTVFASLIGLNSCHMNNTKPTNEKTKTTQSWILNKNYSNISIITTKNSQVSEVSQFKSFSGGINEKGYIDIQIDLKSLETNIPIRNQRIQDHLFQTSLYPTADIHTQLTPEQLNVGVHNIEFDVDLHGVSAMVNAEFMVFEQYGNKIVTLHKPLVIHAKTFALEPGIKTLKNLAFLDSIDLTVPVHLTLTFEPK